MAPDLNLQSLEDVIRWAIQHDTREAVYWENQHDANERQAAKVAGLDRRLTGLEKRVLWLTSGAAALGAALGQLLEGVLPLGG